VQLSSREAPTAVLEVFRKFGSIQFDPLAVPVGTTTSCCRRKSPTTGPAVAMCSTNAARSSRHTQHLPTVADGGDTRAFVHIEADVSLLGQPWLARVHPIRTRIGPSASARWPSVAAATPFDARANATKNASPCVSTSIP
jgi:hypothetical protein